MKYVVLICARNEENYIASCLSSLYFQTVPPELVVVVDDGSTGGGTTLRALYFTDKMKIVVLHHPDRGFSALGSKLMADPYNVGLGWLYPLDWDYLLILGADTAIPPRYVEKLLRNITPEMGVVSGRYPGLDENYAAATGRLIRREIIDELGGRLPRTNAWESSVTHCALFLGYETGSFPVPIYNLRPPGKSMRSNTGPGRAIKELGYIWPQALHKAYLKMRKGELLQALKIVYGYAVHKPQDPLPDWAQFIQARQRGRFKEKIKELLKW